MGHKQAEKTMIDLLTEWVREHRSALEQSGVNIEVNLGPPDRPKRSAALLLESNKTLTHLVLWETGEAHLEVLDPIADTCLLSEHRDLKGETELSEALSTLVKAVTQNDEVGHN